MEGLRNYQAAQSGFAGAAEEMNENAAAFRGKVSAVKNQNKSLVQQAMAATDLNAMKGMGEEAAVRAFKAYGGKALSAIDDKLFDGAVQGDTSKLWAAGKKKLMDGITSKVKAVSSEVEEGGTELGTKAQGFFGGKGDLKMPTKSPGSGGSGAGETKTSMGETKSSMADDTMGETKTSGKSWDDMSPGEKEGELFDKGVNQDSQEAARDADIQPDTRTNEQKWQDSLDDKDEDAANNVNADGTPVVDKTAGETKTSGESKSNAGDDDLEDDGEDELEDEAETTADETAGTLLDATGIGAVIGVPLQIAGAVLEGGALFEAGKSVVDWFEQDILGQKPDIKKIATPVAGLSIAQKGLTATPIFDSSMDAPSMSSSF
mgnify:CR=1 FL=1